MLSVPSARHDPRRILAMGGGGFSAGAGDPALDRYVLDVTEVAVPRVCLLPTASGDPEEQIQRFYRAYGELDCVPTHLSLFRLGSHPVDLREQLLAQDAIYVGGGSLLNLLAIWRAHGLDEILLEAWRRGILLCGISAGSMCWFSAGVTKSFGPPRAVAGLGFLPGSNSVHYRSEPERRPVFREAVRVGEVPPGYGVDDGAGLLFAGTELIEAVSARRDSAAWWVEPSASEATETVVETLPLEPPPQAVTPLSILEFREARRARFGE